MITLHIDGKKEFWDERNSQFVYYGPDEPMDVKLEHSLVSVSKWESKYKKSFTNSEKTEDELLDYLSMMVIGNKEVEPEWFKICCERDSIKKLTDYINDPMTATTISEDTDKNQGNKKIKGKIVTSELVYYWMTALNIPFECQYWHFNRLITLIKVCSIESNPDKNKKKTKFSSADMAARRAKMEAARAKYKH